MIRRDFVKYSGIGLLGLYSNPIISLNTSNLSLDKIFIEFIDLLNLKYVHLDAKVMSNINSYLTIHKNQALILEESNAFSIGNHILIPIGTFTNDNSAIDFYFKIFTNNNNKILSLGSLSSSQIGGFIHNQDRITNSKYSTADIILPINNKREIENNFIVYQSKVGLHKSKTYLANNEFNVECQGELESSQYWNSEFTIQSNYFTLNNLHINTI